MFFLARSQPTDVRLVHNAMQRNGIKRTLLGCLRVFQFFCNKANTHTHAHTLGEGLLPSELPLDENSRAVFDDADICGIQHMCSPRVDLGLMGAGKTHFSILQLLSGTVQQQEISTGKDTQTNKQTHTHK